MRNRVLLLAIAVAAVFVLGASAADEARFMTYPTINGDRIVFTYENDLWSVPAAGGEAVRLTSHPYTENFAKFSPDGRWIAFAGSYDGPPMVYVMPAEGGEPVRLTYNPGFSLPVAWTPDGTRVVFRSMFENVVGRDPNLYFVDREGATAPERLPLERGVLASFSPDGTKMLYVRKGNEEYYWKRYKGGQHTDIWLYDYTAKTYTPVTTYVGKNAYPMWIGGDMWFVSDRTNGITNLYRQAIGAKGEAAEVTTYADFDVMYPNTDGRSIVYVQDGYLHVFDVAGGKDRKITVQAATDRWVRRPRWINPREYVHTWNLANDGKTVALEARGDVFVIDPESHRTTNLSQSPGTREMYPQLSPDGKTVAFFSDKGGDYQLYTQPVEGGAWTQVTTTLDRLVYRLAWSPDGKKILFGNKDYSVFYVDLATKKLVKVDTSNQMKNDEFVWKMDDYAWSPDSNWIVYTQVAYNRNSQVFLYSLAEGKKYAVTDDFFDNLYPRFDADGKYLYYVSSRDFALQMDFYEDNHVEATPQQIMAVQLAAGEKPPFAETGAAVTGEAAGAGGAPAAPSAKGAAPAAKAKPEAKAPAFRIDVEGLSARTFPVPVDPGNYFYLKAGKGKILWASVDRFTEDEYEEIFEPRGATKWDVHIYDVAEKKETVLKAKVADFALSLDGESMIVRRANELATTAVARAVQSKETGEAVDLGGLSYNVDPLAEWRQIFNDTWRWYRDFFYDPGFHGHDWKALGDKFRAYIPDLASRQELNWVLQQMVGEISVSHTYIGGGDPGSPATVPQPAVYTGVLGWDLVADGGFYKIAKIYGPTEYNLNAVGPLVRPDIRVKEGDYLVAIDGKEVRPPADYFRLLQVGPREKVRVTVASQPSAAGARTYEVQPVRSDNQLRYLRWLTDNIRTVLKATDGRVGYMHINAMGGGGIGEFDKFWRAFRYKDAVIIDVRRNSGGWTEYFLIDKLERQLVAYNVLRDMVPFRYPGGAGNGNYVVVSNEYNGSDGEAFVEHFKARKLGTVVGVPSWGGLVGILNRQLTIDNGTVEQSNNSFYGRDGKWWVENHGADPDIVVDNDPASAVAGRDLQLDKSIQVALEKIKANPNTFPPKPPYSKR